jgi:hypothetical protein
MSKLILEVLNDTGKVQHYAAKVKHDSYENLPPVVNEKSAEIRKIPGDTGHFIKIIDPDGIVEIR